MNKLKVFGKIVYFIFTFAIGILLAVILPSLYLYEEGMKVMTADLEQGRYSQAMSMVGGYYNAEQVYHKQFEGGGGIVLFEATTLMTKADVADDRQDEFVDESKLQKAYAGFVYGVKDNYNVKSKENNGAKIVITDFSDIARDLYILDYDLDDNGTNDTIAAMDFGIIFIEIAQSHYPSVKQLDLIDSNGKVFQSVDLSSKQLDFSSQFFVDVEPFLTEYNRDYQSTQLPQMYKDFTAKNPNYKMSSQSEEAVKNSEKRATVVVVVYFVCIYVAADFIFTSFYIIKFFKWILVKVFKVKFKKKKTKTTADEGFGGDYFCKVTYVVDVTGTPEFDQSIQIHYNNGEAEANFLLMKSNDYTATQRLKAGEYVNLHVDLDKGYALTDTPETLVAEGYQKTITLKLLKREE